MMPDGTTPLDFAGQVSELDTFIHTGHQGLSYALAATRFIEILKRMDLRKENANSAEIEKAYERKMKIAKEIEPFAGRQLAKGFPYLMSMAVIRLWSIIEASVHALAIEVLKDPERIKSMESTAKLKIPIGEFIGTNEEERPELVLQYLKQELRSSLKQGVGQFESTLEPLGLGGSVHDLLRKVLFELSAVRNVIVHRHERTDRRFLQQCPWMKMKIGEVIEVSDQRFNMYQRAASWYLLQLHSRSIQFGINSPVDDPDPTLLDSVTKKAENAVVALAFGIYGDHEESKQTALQGPLPS